MRSFNLNTFAYCNLWMKSELRSRYIFSKYFLVTRSSILQSLSVQKNWTRMNQDTQKLTLELFPLTPNVVMNVAPISDKIDLARMRLLSSEEREEEQQYGVSTELNLFTDPWTIKKELTITDISYLNHLLLNTSTIHHHILRYLPECDRKIVQEGWAFAVDVYDHDTDSTHQMLLRKCDQVSLLCSHWWMVRGFCLQEGFEDWRWDWNVLGSFWLEASFQRAASWTSGHSSCRSSQASIEPTQWTLYFQNT